MPKTKKVYQPSKQAFYCEPTLVIDTPLAQQVMASGITERNLPNLGEDMDKCNVIEIEGLLFPGFGPMCALHGKLVFPIKCHHEGAQKWSSLVENFERPRDIT